MRKLLLFTFTFIFLTTQSQLGKEKKIARNPENNQIIYFANGGPTDNAVPILNNLPNKLIHLF